MRYFFIILAILPCVVWGQTETKVWPEQLKNAPAAGYYPVSGSGGVFSYATIPEGIATVADYAELRATPPAGDLVFVTGTASKPDIAGLFYKYQGTTTGWVDNAGTRIEDTNTDWWERVRPDGLYKPQWFPYGEFSANLSAEGDTIRTDSDIFNHILRGANEGALMIDISDDDGPARYNFDTPVDLPDRGVRIVGVNDTISRIDAVWAVVTTGGTSGSTSIVVDDATGFREGQQVAFITDETTTGVIVDKQISSVSGNTLNLQGTLGATVSIGDTAVVVFDLFKDQSSLDTLRGLIEFSGIIFYGNRANNNITYHWTYNNTLDANNQNTLLRFKDCRFVNTPTENVISGEALHMVGCQGEDLGGSFAHASGLVNTTPEIVIRDCYVHTSGIIGNAVTGHSEAVIVTSASPANITVHNSQFFNGNEAFFGDIGGGVDRFECVNSRIEEHPAFIYGTIGTGTLDHMVIKDNVVVNCVMFEALGDLSQNEGLRYLELSGNTFVNTALDLRGVMNSKVHDNTFSYDRTRGGFASQWSKAVSNSLYNTPTNRLIHFEGVRNFSFSDNLILGDTVAYNDTIEHAVAFDDAGFGGTSNYFYLDHDIQIRGNTIQGFHKSLLLNDNASALPFGTEVIKQFDGWHISGNSIYMLEDNVDDTYGAVVFPGMHFTGNYIRMNPDTTLADNYGLIIEGVNDRLGANTSLLGPTVTFNTIDGFWKFDGSNVTVAIGGRATNTDDLNVDNILVQWNTFPTNPGGNAPSYPARNAIMNNVIRKTATPTVARRVVPPNQ